MTIRLLSALALSALVISAASCSSGSSGKQEGQTVATNIPDSTLDGLINAPDFPSELEWLNSDHKISLREFRGKLVLLDFWTFCCINCMHVIPDLKKLEAKYPNELVVIGVHSAKFANEKGTEAIRQAILRYEIHHPVINDHEFQVWQSYGARAWPTLVLINPNGKIIGGQSGEGAFELFDPIIAKAIPYFTAKGQLKPSPVSFALESHKTQSGILSFPGKVSADAKKKRLVISDSNHNRILVTDLTGVVIETIGSGEVGTADGSFATAQFNHPQGAFVNGDTLYIADTENHLIRVADLNAKTVTTVLGTGSQARDYNQPGTGRSLALNSPWDLLAHDGKLYIAMAGAHQIWVADIKSWEARPWAGSAREDIHDGPLAEASLAQPSGLSTDGKKLYWADSETSSIRRANLSDTATVETIVGAGLFEFGNIDGATQTARFQHPLGVLYHDGKLFVADTYNSTIRTIDQANRTVATLAGTGRGGYADGDFKMAQFFEPGAVAVVDNILYVADVNNHKIRTINLATNKVGTLDVRQSGVHTTAISVVSSTSKVKASADPTTPPKFTGRIVKVGKQTIDAGSGTISVIVDPPHGYHLTDQAPSYLSWYSGDAKVVSFPRSFGSYDPGTINFPFDLAVKTTPGQSLLTMDVVAYFCENKSTVCMFDKFRIEVPIEVVDGGPQKIQVSTEIEAPDER